VVLAGHLIVTTVTIGQPEHRLNQSRLFGSIKDIAQTV